MDYEDGDGTEALRLARARHWSTTSPRQMGWDDAVRWLRAYARSEKDPTFAAALREAADEMDTIPAGNQVIPPHKG